MKTDNSSQQYDVFMNQSWMEFEFSSNYVHVNKKEYPEGISLVRYHRHDFSQMMYCLRGSFTHYLNESSRECPEGTLAIISPGTFHKFSIEPGCIIMYIDIAYNAFENGLTKGFPHLMALSLFPRTAAPSSLSLPEYLYAGDARDAIEPYLLSAKDSFLHNKNDKKISLLLEKFFSALFPLSNKQAARIEKIYKVRISPIVSALDYLNTHYAQKIYCEDILRETSLCSTDFYSYFKQFLGITYSVYLQMVRVARAHRAVAFTPYSISYIANMCGFSDNAYMTKIYKKYKGYTPTEERARRNITNPSFAHLRISHDFFYSTEK